MLNKLMISAAMIGGLTLLGGCADGNFLGGSTMTTQAVPAAPAVDPACTTLSAQIETLRKDGIADKVEKAAAKKHKMTSTELAKASELNKANAEFQAKCSTVPKAPMQTAAAAPAPAPAAASVEPAKAVKTVAKAAKAAKADAPKP